MANKPISVQVKELVRRKRGPGVSTGHDRDRQEHSRTYTTTLVARDDDPPITDGVQRGNTAYRTPDDTRQQTIIDTVNGHRLQDFANSGLSEGEAPGRIPHFWNDRRQGKVGRTATGNPVGDNFLTLGLSGQRAGGEGDAAFLRHQQIPRGVVVARGFARTIDDAAIVPAVYVSDPTRR